MIFVNKRRNVTKQYYCEFFKEIKNLTDAELDSFDDNVIDDDETITIGCDGNEFVKNGSE